MTFVADVVQANIIVAENNAEGVFNIGSASSTTINQLANLLIRLTGKDLKAIHQEPRPGEPRHTLGDISKAKSFGYEPKYDLEAGLKQTIEEFRGWNTI